MEVLEEKVQCKHIASCLHTWIIHQNPQTTVAYACKSVIAQLLKNLPAMQEPPVGFLGQEDLENG